MNIQVQCLNCKKLLSVSDTLLGKHIRCPSCASSFPVEAANARPDTGPDAVTDQPAERPLPAPRERPRYRDDDDRPSRARYREDDDNPYRKRDDDNPVTSLIPYRNGKALAAYYCGVFSLIPCLGLVLGPLALILGILGFRYVRRYPEARGTGHALAGIILGTLTTLLNLVPLGFVVVMAGASAWQSSSTMPSAGPSLGPPPSPEVLGKDKPLPAPDHLFQGPRTYLSDLQEFDVLPQGRSLGKNGDVGNPTHDRIVVNGQASPKGLGLFHISTGYGGVKYRLDGKYSGFLTTVALNDPVRGKQGVVFLAFGDDKKLWTSKRLRARGETDECRIDVTGVNVLFLRTDGGVNENLYALWIDPCLYASR